MIKFLFYTNLWLIVFGLLTRIDIAGVGILPSDILLPILGIFWLGKKIIFREKFSPFSISKIGFLFILILIFSFFLGAGDLFLTEKIISFSYIIRLIFFWLFAWVGIDLLQTKSAKKSFFNHLILIVLVILTGGFLQFYLVPDIGKFSTEGGLDPHTGRLLGTWLDPNYLAGFFGFLLPIFIAKFYETEKSLRKILLLLISVLILVSLFLTFSRSGYLASVIGLVLFFAYKDWKILLLGFLAIILSISFNERSQKRITELVGTFSAIIFEQTDEVDPTASLRIQNWEKSFELFRKNPITGIGYNTYRYKASDEGIIDENYYSAGGADSTHLTILITTGVLGFLVYLLFLGKIFWSKFREFLKTKSYIYLGFCSGFLSLLIHSCFVNSLFFPLIFIPVMAVFGCLENKSSS